MSISGPISPGFSFANPLDSRVPPSQDTLDSAQSGKGGARSDSQTRPALRDRVETESALAQADPTSVFAALAASNTPPPDADAARLLALSVRQGLQEQSASIANLRPNSILQYLRA